MKHRAWAALAVAALAVQSSGTDNASDTSVGAAETTISPASDEPLDPPVDVSWAVTGTVGEAGLYVALEKGYFEDEGLNVEFIEMRRFADELPLLATGELDLGTGGLNPDLWNAIEQDIPVRIVASHVTQVPGSAQSALVVRQELIDDGTYQDLGSLEGMRIGINSLGSSSQYYVEKMLEQADLTAADVEFVALGFPDMAAALSNGAIDAVLAVEPFINNMVRSGLGETVITTTEAAPGAIGSVIVISPVFAEENPEAAKRLMYAFLKGQREYLDAFITGANPEGRDEIIDILTQWTTITDPALFEGIGMSGGDPNGKFDLASLEEFQDYFLEQGTIDTALDVNEMVDFQYLDYAVDRLEREGA